jgi:hypothetical protein
MAIRTFEEYCELENSQKKTRKRRPDSAFSDEEYDESLSNGYDSEDYGREVDEIMQGRPDLDDFDTGN